MGAGFSSMDAATSGEIFRKNHPIILACNRNQAWLAPIRIYSRAAAPDTFVAGTVVARNSTSGFYERYNDSASSGLNTAVGILFNDVTPSASGETDMGVCIMGGKVYESKLTGLDAAAKVDLKSRSVVDATGVTVLSF